MGKKSCFFVFKTIDKPIIDDRLCEFLALFYNSRSFYVDCYNTFDNQYTILVVGNTEKDIDIQPLCDDIEENVMIGCFVRREVPQKLYSKMDHQSFTKTIFKLLDLKSNFKDLDQHGVNGYGILYNSNDKKLMVKTNLPKLSDFQLNFGFVDSKVEIYSNNFQVLYMLCEGNAHSIENGYYENNYTLDGNFIVPKDSFVDSSIIIDDKDKFPHLGDFEGGIYLTDQNYEYDPAIGREQEIRELSKSLLIPKKAVLLVGNPGVGKTAIVEGLAYKIKTDEICESLKGKSILSVNSTELLAGTKYRGDFENRISKLCKGLSDKNGGIILFLDEMHTVLDANRNVEGGFSLADMLKPYISSGILKMIGCTTNEEYKLFCEDPAFRRRFKVLDVKEQNDDIIKGILINYILNNYYKVNINMTDDEINKLLDAIIKLSKRKQMHTNVVPQNPDASISILMSAFAYMELENIKHATLKDFIDGILDDSSLSLMDIDRQLLLKIAGSSEDDYYLERRGQISLIKRK